MIAKTALLVVTNPSNIGKILPAVEQCINKAAVLYIQLLSSVQEPVSLSYRKDIFTTPPHYSKIIHGIYSQAANFCQHLDVRILLSSLKFSNVTKISTCQPIELIIFDKKHSEIDINTFLKVRIGNKTSECNVMTIDNNEKSEEPNVEDGGKMYSHAVLGGTFDHLHVAHKVLLSEAALRSTANVTVGITDDTMIKNKTLWELIEPIEYRTEGVKSFLNDICPELNVAVMPIHDPFGPTQHDPTMELLVVSKETIGGGKKVNEVRKCKNLPELDILEVELVDEPHRLAPEEETKISSSTERMRLLGSLLKPVIPKPDLPSKPYILGLTGGIASGKTNVANDLKNLGAHVIDCDKVGHQVYIPGTECHAAIAEQFGNEILADDGTIDRRKLGAIVFQDVSALQKLNSLVWPAIAAEVQNIISNCASDVVIIDAAILLQAGWQSQCHEVWTMIIPYEEAILRLKTRNGLTEAQAKARVDAQPPTVDYVKNSNVVFCSLWTREYTKKQVERAWNDLRSRLL